MTYSFETLLASPKVVFISSLKENYWQQNDE